MNSTKSSLREPFHKNGNIAIIGLRMGIVKKIWSLMGIEPMTSPIPV